MIIALNILHSEGELLQIIEELQLKKEINVYSSCQYYVPNHFF